MHAWNWIAANGFAVLAAVYLASTLCMLALALHAHWLSVRTSRLSRETHRLSALVDTLVKAENARAEALEILRMQFEAVLNASSGNGTETIPEEDRARLRNELESLIAEITTDDRHEQPHPDSVGGSLIESSA